MDVLSSQQKRELLAQLVRQMPSPSSGSGQLSHGQAALWLTHRLAPQSWAYHVVFSARIRSRVDASVLQQALQVLLDRHGMLRTTYAEHDGVPTAQLHAEMPVDFHVMPVDPQPWEDHREQVLADVRQPFDLEHGPILRARLYRRSDDDALLVLTVHHIAIDFWSLGVLLQELRVAYAALRAQQPVSLPPLRVTYADYVRWQTDMLAAPEGERLRAYWQQQLAGELPGLELPLSRPRPRVQTYRGDTHPFQLSAPLTGALNALAQREGVTLYMMLLAALQVLLYRYSGQADIRVGSPMAGRHQPALRPLVGYCVNPVVMRADLSGHPTFCEFLSQVRHTALDALRHADYPFPLLVEQIQPQRDASRSPLFQVGLVLQTLAQAPDLLPCFMPSDAESKAIAFGDLVLEPYPLPQQEGQFDLTLEMAEIGSGLCGLWQYNADLFDADTAERMARHFTTLLEGVIAQPDAPIEMLPLLTAAERHQILESWNETQVDGLRGLCIHQLIEVQVERTPDAVALVYHNCQITYREMNRRANQLAHYLHAMGVKLGALVGLCVASSPEMVVGLLGILKAGGAYVALDPTYPKDRLDFMIQDTQVSLILTQAALAAELPTQGLCLLCLDADWREIAQQRDDNLGVEVTPAHLAYVLYTSGSTGRPKGVLVSHRGFESLAIGQWRAFGVQSDSRVFQYASLNFDVSIWEVIMALSAGAQLWLRTPDDILAGEAFAHQLNRQGITHMTLTPSVLATMPAGGCPELATLIAAAERCDPELAASWSPGRRFFNAYGPTEYTVCTAMGRYANDGQTLSIGRPLPNIQVYIFGPQNQPVPVGVVGELYIGGIGLAWGYHNRPGLTAERFVPHPLSGEPGARLYQTGDRVSYLSDGNIEIFGRTDSQVKIRGFRIELHEIEAVLRQHDRVQDAAVVVREVPPEHKQLAAYVVTTAQIPELRDFVQQKLPDYMVPATFRILDALPRNPNGKVDRQALPTLETIRSTAGSVGPKTPEEACLLPIWRQALSLEAIDIHDNFFDLGGHSLQAMQLVSQVAVELQRDVPVHALFLYPTVASLAQALDTFPHALSPVSRVPSDGHVKPSALRPPLQPSSPFTTFDRSPMLPRLVAGDLAPVHAATLAYLPAELVNLTGASRDRLLREWCAHRPGIASLIETAWGRIALIVLPVWSDELYRDPDGLTAIALDALTVAGDIGARTVSLSGLLPSATDYGRALTTALAGQTDQPQLSTGHAITTSAIVLMIDQLLHEGGRHLVQEGVGFLGLGSIGRATLSLMLHALPHPAEVLLCDIYAQRQALERLARRLREELRFQGRIRIMTADPDVPAAFYESTLIIGAANVPHILDVDRLKPGTMIVDDSAPHCFNPDQAVQRFQQHGDLLFTEGGLIRLSHPLRELRYVPPAVEQILTVQQLDTLFARHDPHEIMGCTLSSLLSARLGQFAPTVGFVDLQTSQQSYDMLKRLGGKAARLQCAGYILAEDARRQFRRQFHAL